MHLAPRHNAGRILRHFRKDFHNGEDAISWREATEFSGSASILKEEPRERNMTRLRSLTETVLRLRVRAVATLAAFALAGGAALAEDNPNTQTAELYQLQAAFHRAASVQDPLNGDSAAVVDQRIREMLSIWTEDGILRLSVGN